MLAPEFDAVDRSSCGVPDCDPPPTFEILKSILTSIIIIPGSDILFYSLFSREFADEGMRETPLYANIIIGYLIVSILFVLVYIHYARPPRTWEKEKNYRSRTQKGMLYGFSVGSLVFIPGIFIMSSIEIDFNLSRSLLEAIFHVFQLTLAGLIIAHLLGTPTPLKTEKVES